MNFYKQSISTRQPTARLAVGKKAKGMINKPMRILKIEEVQKMLMQNGHNL
jgi:hypothetical protein